MEKKKKTGNNKRKMQNSIAIHADLSGVEPGQKGNRSEYKKYIFMATGKFSKTNSNG